MPPLRYLRNVVSRLSPPPPNENCSGKWDFGFDLDQSTPPPRKWKFGQDLGHWILGWPRILAGPPPPQWCMETNRCILQGYRLVLLVALALVTSYWLVHPIDIESACEGWWGLMNGTLSFYECRFSCWDTRRWWGNSNPTCNLFTGTGSRDTKALLLHPRAAFITVNCHGICNFENILIENILYSFRIWYLFLIATKVNLKAYWWQISAMEDSIITEMTVYGNHSICTISHRKISDEKRRLNCDLSRIPTCASRLYERNPLFFQFIHPKIKHQVSKFATCDWVKSSTVLPGLGINFEKNPKRGCPIKCKELSCPSFPFFQIWSDKIYNLRSFSLF